MNQEELTSLALDYKTALLGEQESKFDVAEAQNNLEREKSLALSVALSDGQITGKNAETRKIQESNVLEQCERYRDTVAAALLAEKTSAYTTVERQYFDALIGLTKAWLYSQSGVGK